MSNISIAQFNANVATNTFTLQQTVAQSIGYGLTPANVAVVSIVSYGSSRRSLATASAPARADRLQRRVWNHLQLTLHLPALLVTPLEREGHKSSHSEAESNTVTPVESEGHKSSHFEAESNTATATGIVVTYQVLATAAGYSSSTAAYSAYSSQLTGSVSSGLFQLNLVAYSQVNGATALSASVAQVPLVQSVGGVPSVAPSAAPAQRPTLKPTSSSLSQLSSYAAGTQLSTMDIVGIVLGGMVGMCCLGAVVTGVCGVFLGSSAYCCFKVNNILQAYGFQNVYVVPIV